jgi:hypothetical protein
MFAKARRFVVAVALFLSIGSQWFCLQSLAWATMMIDFSQHGSLRQAITQTFDGAHPCHICKQISKARETEKKQDTRRSFTKANLICTFQRIVLMPPFAPFHYPDLDSIARPAFRKIPYPPPRFALV